MFRIIGIELLDAEDMLFDYLNQHPDVGDDNRQWMERIKFPLAFIDFEWDL